MDIDGEIDVEEEVIRIIRLEWFGFYLVIILIKRES